jgi:hypothetical protein
VIFLDLSRLSYLHHSRDLFNVRHSAGSFLKKARHVTEKMPSTGDYGECRGRWWKMVLNGSDDSAEKSRIKPANSLKIYHVNKFMSLFKVCQSKYCIK